MGVGPVGPPIVTSGAPLVLPQTPTMQHGAPTSYPGQQAAQAIDYNALRGFAQAARQPSGIACGPEGPSLRDIAPPSFLDKIPLWAKIAAGVTATGLAIGLIVYFTRR